MVSTAKNNKHVFAILNKWRARRCTKLGRACKLVVSKNIPRSWRTQFRLAGRHVMQSLLDQKRILLLLEKEEKSKSLKSNAKDRKSKGNSNSKDGGVSRPKKSGIKNPCKLPGHQNHDWKDCFNNPKSDKFKGTARKPSDYDKDGKLKKKIKKSQQTESKKKKKRRMKRKTLSPSRKRESTCPTTIPSPVMNHLIILMKRQTR